MGVAVVVVAVPLSDEAVVVEGEEGEEEMPVGLVVVVVAVPPKLTGLGTEMPGMPILE